MKPTWKTDGLTARYSWCWACSEQLYAQRGVLVVAPGGHVARVHRDCMKREGLPLADSERTPVLVATQDQIDRARSAPQLPISEGDD